MGIVELIAVALGLSMDAFAVAICKGLCMKRLRWRQALVIAAFFGVFSFDKRDIKEKSAQENCLRLYKLFSQLDKKPEKTY